MLWTVVSFALGLLAAALGGLVCARISGGDKAPLVLAGLVLVLGLLFAIPVLLTPTSAEVRTGEVSNLDAMQKARQPAWVAAADPILGAVGVMLGARLRRRG